MDSSIGAGIGAEKTTSTLLLLYPEIGIPGERGLWANFDTFFRLTGNTLKDLLLFGPIGMDSNS